MRMMKNISHSEFCSNVSEGMNNEKMVRLTQLGRRMREIEWVWLSAGMGMVEGGSNPVEAYLNSRGDQHGSWVFPRPSYGWGQGQGCMTWTSSYVASKLAVSIQRQITLFVRQSSGRVGSTSATCPRLPPTPCPWRWRTCPPRLRSSWARENSSEFLHRTARNLWVAATHYWTIERGLVQIFS